MKKSKLKFKLKPHVTFDTLANYFSNGDTINWLLKESNREFQVKKQNKDGSVTFLGRFNSVWSLPERLINFVQKHHNHPLTDMFVLKTKDEKLNTN